MLSKITGREILEEARMPNINIVLRARDLRWNWLGHILGMGERRTVRQVLLHCVKRTQESIFGDLIDPDVDKAISLAKDRAEWNPILGNKRRNHLHLQSCCLC